MGLRGIRIATYIAIGMMVVVGLAAERPDPRGAAKEIHCKPEAGAILVLCRVYHDDGLVLEFARPVTNAFFLFGSSDAFVEVWLRRIDIGDASRAKIHGPAPNGTGVGISIDPGYVAVRLTGRLLVIEDVVYARPD